jgi:hypothetical protein
VVVRQAVIAVGVVLTLASAAIAQTGRAAANQASAQDQVKARSNLSIMEGVLERAVVLGADSLTRRVRAVAPHDMLLLAGDANVRGFRLEGYGVFFDVEVPVLRQSVAWSLRALMDQSGVPLGVALQQLRTYVRTIQDPRARQSLEMALRRVELQVGGDVPSVTAASAAPGQTTSAATVAAAAAPAAPPVPQAALAWLNDPNGAYTTEVKNSLIDAMLEHSSALGIGPDEWLTVAARDNERRDRLNPGDDVSTIILRVKGSDLAALRAGRLTAEEARTKVEVREY